MHWMFALVQQPQIGYVHISALFNINVICLLFCFKLLSNSTGQALSRPLVERFIYYNVYIRYLSYFLLHFWLDARLHFVALYLYM